MLFTLTTLLIMCGFVSFSQNDSLIIPKGVNYSTAEAKVNQEAIKAIQNELNAPSYLLFDDMLYMGPNLWERYGKLKEISKIDKGNIIFKVPQTDGSLTDMSGKLIQNIDDFKIVWNQIIKDFASSPSKLRKLNTDELNYYWSIIFFDITEPIYIIENDDLKLVLDLRSEMTLLFVEEISW